MKQFLLILFVTCSTLSFAFGNAAISVDPSGTEPEISIFPNPTSQYFELKNGNDVKQVVVYNLFGTKVKSFISEGQKRFDIAELTDGMYLVQLLDANQGIITTRRLSKK